MRAVIVAIVLLLISQVAQSRTWRVNTAGTGDAPTLHAAMDSAVAYDVVIAEAGEYNLGNTLFIPQRVELIGEAGPAETLLYGVDVMTSLYTVHMPGAKLTGVYVRGSTAAIMAYGGCTIQNCIIEATYVDGWPLEGYDMNLNNCLVLGRFVAATADFVYCIISSDLGSMAIGSMLWECDVLGEVDPAIDASAAQGNFSLDPRFCGIPGSGNYFLQSNSPCLPENNPYGVPILVGPLPAGCGTVATEQQTWGGIKNLYRQPE
jgi:hypothetical protein